MSRFFFSVLLLLVAIVAEAQNNFLNELRRSEAGKGKVTVTQSAAIEALVNGNAQGSTMPSPQQNRPSTVPQTPVKEQSQPAGTTNHDNRKAEPEKSSAVPHSPSVSAESSSSADVTVDTRKKVMRNSYKTTGYRIQVYSGGNSRADRQKAESAGSAMKRMFPSEPIYVHFYSPSWKCRMGNYKTLEEAKRVLKEVKAAYPQACIVKGTISVQY